MYSRVDLWAGCGNFTLENGSGGMTASLLGYSLELGWLLKIHGPGINFSLELLPVIFLGLLVVFLLKKARRVRENNSRRLGLSFGCSRGVVATYEEADRKLEYLNKDLGPVVAVVDVGGAILDGSGATSPPQLWPNSATFGRELRSVLVALSSRKNLSAVMVRMNTPGGTIAGSQYIFDGLKICQDAGKMVVCYAQGMAASGGVMAMVGAGVIVAHPAALLGSIGVRGPTLRHFEEVTRVGGVFNQVEAKRMSFVSMTAGKGKDFGNPFLPRDESGIRNYQKILDDQYEMFLKHVSVNRGIEKETLRELGAAVLSAQDARELGLVDILGDEPYARSVVARSLGRRWEDCQILRIVPARPSRFVSGLGLWGGLHTPEASTGWVQMELASQPILAIAGQNIYTL